MTPHTTSGGAAISMEIWNVVLRVILVRGGQPKRATARYRAEARRAEVSSVPWDVNNDTAFAELTSYT
jgi:hypothetical protein